MSMDFNAQTPMSEEVKNWLAQIEAARKREQDFRKEGRRIVKIFEAEKKEEYQFNILYSNTETLAPALYNSVPRPVVQRRFKDNDPTGLAASQTTQRTLAFLLDSNDSDHSNFDEMMRQAVLEALLPGRGLTRFKYEATFKTRPAEGIEPPNDDDDSDEAPQATVEEVSKETVCGEEVPWDRFLCGYAKKWKDVPWIAFEHFFSKTELADNFGEELAAQIPLTITGGKDSDDEGAEDSKPKDAEGEKLAHVYEIWDKHSKKVIFIAAGFGVAVKAVDDPLGLSGFYPCPRPLGFMSKISTITPTALYLMYEEQAKELNYVTLRINKIMRALKIRGFYDSTLQGLDQLMNSDDNTLQPAENVSAMLQGQTLDKAIWFFPVERLVPVLQQLYLQRTQIKDTIYEITGISDILRGASVASETATAQNIKNQWGTLRLKRLQKEVQRYVRDCLRLMAEIAVKHLSPPTIAAMTSLPLPQAAQKQQAQMAWQQMQQQAAMTGQQPPQQPPQELAQVLASPTLEDVLGLLRDDLHRAYRIDIETNSTVDESATEDKELISDFMNALSQFLNGVAPLVEQGILPFDAAKAMMLAIVRRFRFGDEVEEQLKAMQAPAPKQPEDTGAAEKKQQAALDLQMKQADAAAQQQELQSNAELKKMEMALKMQELQRKEQLTVVEHQMKMQEMALKNAEMKQRAKMLADQQRQQQHAKGKKNANV